MKGVKLKFALARKEEVFCGATKNIKLNCEMAATQ